MNTYRPDRRDPLTCRVARGVRDTISDPWAYSEGSSEPEYIEKEIPSLTLGEKVLFWLGVIGGPVLLVLIATGSI